MPEDVSGFWRSLISNGSHSRAQIALLIKVGRNGVNKWVANLPAHGLAGLDTMRPPGNPAGLNELKRSQLLLY